VPPLSQVFFLNGGLSMTPLAVRVYQSLCSRIHDKLKKSVLLNPTQFQIPCHTEQLPPVCCFFFPDFTSLPLLNFDDVLEVFDYQLTTNIQRR
jgi:hypothetical protein